MRWKVYGDGAIVLFQQRTVCSIVSRKAKPLQYCLLDKFPELAITFGCALSDDTANGRAEDLAICQLPLHDCTRKPTVYNNLREQAEVPGTGSGSAALRERPWIYSQANLE